MIKKSIPLFLIFISLAGIIYINNYQRLITKQLNFPEKYIWEGISPNWNGQKIEDIFSSAEIIVRYPHSVWYGQEKYIYWEYHNPQKHNSEEIVLSFSDSLIFNIIVELKIGSLPIHPNGEMYFPLQSQEQIGMRWKVEFNQNHLHNGRLWVYISVLNLDENISSQATLFAIPIEIKTISLFGLGIHHVQIIFAKILLINLFYFFYLVRIRQ